MTRHALALIAAACLTTAAAAAPKPAPHTPAAAKLAAATAAPAPPSGPFDARDPASLSSLLTSLGATVQSGARDNGGVILKATSPVGAFTVQYDGCNQQGRVCAGVLFEALAEAKTATLAEVNGFNQSAFACRIFQDKANKPHVLYSTLVFPDTSRLDMANHVNAWRGCLAEFGRFLKDPPGYLAVAP